MPRKEFESFTRLDASDVNTYLMDQSVMTFAGTAARGSAITTPVEGMVTYLEDSDSLQLYDGSGWTAVGGVSSGNAIINGAFEINQRNFTSLTGTDSPYGFDRWQLVNPASTATYSSQSFTPGDAPVAGYEAATFARIVTSGQSGSSIRTNLKQGIEDVRTFAGETVTVSFFAKAASGTPKIAVEFFQSFGSGGSPSTAVSTYAGSVTLSTSWNRYSVTTTVPSISGKTIGTTANSSSILLNLWVSGGSDFDARTDSLGIQNNTFDFWGVQLEAGSTANVFRRNANSLQGELAACQRYYYRAGAGDSTLSALSASGYTQSATTVIANVDFPVTMRTIPTSIEFSDVGFREFSSPVKSVTGLTLGTSQTSTKIGFVFGTISSTSGIPGFLCKNANANAFLAFSAEL
jgi:hypothetical protein